MRQKVESGSSYSIISGNHDGLALLVSIKEIVYQFQSSKFVMHAVHDATRRFYTYSQGKHATTAVYLEQYQNIVDVINQVGGSVGKNIGLVKEYAKVKGVDFETLSNEALKKLKEETYERYLATSFVLAADRSRYGRLIESLENDYLQGRDNYPTTLTSAYNLLTNWKQDPRNLMRSIGPVNDGVSFATTDGTKDKSHIQCHKCKQYGHYANKCKQAQSAATLLTTSVENGNGNFMCSSIVLITHGITLQSQSNNDYHIPPTWILLDNQSTIDVFNNSDLLENIRQTTRKMHIHCNAGVAITDMVGDLPGYGTVWYYPDGVANILSLSRVCEAGYKVVYDSTNGNKFMVSKPGGTIMQFNQSAQGLFYIDTKDNGMVFINTVADNKNKYTNRDYNRAVLARKIQTIIGRPNTRAYINIVENNLLKNCPVTRQDILAAEHIFGPDVGSLKGKTTRRTGTPVKIHNTDIPASIMTQYKTVVLCGDIMFVNRIPFFMTISRHIKFSTVEMIENQQNTTIIKAIKQVKAIYMQRGFTISTILLDGQFESIRGELAELQITLNTVSNDEHVPEAERHIRTIKERARCVYNTLPFRRLPKRIVIELIYYSNFWLNSFPALDGISKTLSPRTIVTGMQIDYEHHCQLEFGSYAQVHEDHDNSMATRTTGAIALRPTGNTQGGYFFFSLTTGRVLRRNNWTLLPMPADVIERIHVMARRNDNGFFFRDRHGNPLPSDTDDDHPDDLSWHPDDPNDDDVSDSVSADPDDVSIAGVNDVLTIDAAPFNADNNIDIEPAADVPAEDINDADIDDNENPIIQLNHPNNDNAANDYHNNIEQMVVDINDDNINELPVAPLDNDIAQQMDERYGPRNNNYNLRPRHARDYSHLHTVFTSTILTQHSMKKGIKLYGDAGVDAVLKELQQLHDRNVLEPISSNDLTPTEKKAALQYLMFLKQKRNGTIKGRGCADGRKQRDYIAKEDASSPTVSIESVMISTVIDAKERRDVATIDIPGAFMQADMDDIVHMKLEGTMAELLVKIDPILYRKYIQNENGKPVLYVALKKALYGTLKAALLFWKKLTSKLKEWGFTINPYDSCVANKEINGSQCTILWHVDDLKISHVDADVVTSIIKLVSQEFGKEAPLTIN
jgi:hypothetical protein